MKIEVPHELVEFQSHHAKVIGDNLSGSIAAITNTALEFATSDIERFQVAISTVASATAQAALELERVLGVSLGEEDYRADIAVSEYMISLLRGDLGGETRTMQ